VEGTIKVEIEVDRANNMHTVRIGETYEDQLCWDEALGVIASILIEGPDGRRKLRTAEQHAAFRRQIGMTEETSNGKGASL
jgi:hypothetical protein